MPVNACRRARPEYSLRCIQTIARYGYAPPVKAIQSMPSPLRVLATLFVFTCTTVVMAAPAFGLASSDESSALGLLFAGVLSLWLLRRRQNVI